MIQRLLCYHCEAQAPDAVKQERPQTCGEAICEAQPPAIIERPTPATELPRLLGRESLDQERAASEATCGGSALTPRQPDFSGIWVAVRVEGDLVALTNDEGISPELRRAAARTAKSVGMASMRIVQRDDKLFAKVSDPRKPGALYYVWCADGLERDEITKEGHLLKVVAEWDADVLEVRSRRADASEPLPTLRRYLRNEDELVSDYVWPGGHVLGVVFRRSREISRSYSSSSVDERVSLVPSAGLDSLLEGKATPTSRQLSRESSWSIFGRRESSWSSLARRPDLSGSWISARVEGDLEALAEDEGISEEMRRAAAATAFGVGKTCMQIKMCEHHFAAKITNAERQGATRIRVWLGGREIVTRGRRLKVSAYWDGNVMVVERTDVETSEALPVSRRYLRGDELVSDLVWPGGHLLRNVFARL